MVWLRRKKRTYVLCAETAHIEHCNAGQALNAESHLPDTWTAEIERSRSRVNNWHASVPDAKNDPQPLSLEQSKTLPSSSHSGTCIDKLHN